MMYLPLSFSAVGEGAHRGLAVADNCGPPSFWGQPSGFAGQQMGFGLGRRSSS